MAQNVELLNVGTGPNTGDGEPIRDAFVKINANFTTLIGQAGEFVVTAQEAVEAANSASETANSAESLAQSALSTSQSALQTSQSAEETAGEALEAANSAVDTAEQAQTTASDSDVKAQNAVQLADSAVTVASMANSAASSAETAAYQARTTANAADSTANAANSKADGALSRSEDALTRAVNAENTSAAALATSQSAESAASSALSTVTQVEQDVGVLTTSAQDAVTRADEAVSSAEEVLRAIGDLSEGQVLAFNGRVGLVVPAVGDYTPEMVGLGNVNNTPDSEKEVSEPQRVFVESAISQAISDLLGGATPETLDTLAEIAEALGNDPDFAATMAQELAGKLGKEGGVLTGDLTAPNFIGRLQGTADKSVRLSAPVNITIGATTKSFDGSEGFTFTAEELGIQPATSTAAGLMSAADKLKLDGVASQATKNSADSYLLDRANHSGTQSISTVEGLQEALDAAAESGGGGIEGAFVPTDSQVLENKVLLKNSMTITPFEIPAGSSVELEPGTVWVLL